MAQQSHSRSRRWRLCTLGCATVLALIALGWAATRPSTVDAMRAVSTAVPIKLKSKSWAALSTEQKLVLAPLAGEWDTLEPYRKTKWLAIARHYALLTPAEQERVQRRMKAWVKLSPEERKVARAKYLNLRHAEPLKQEAIKQKWAEYALLPEAEKQRLSDSAKKPHAGKSGSIGRQLRLPGEFLFDGSASVAVSAQTAPQTPPTSPTLVAPKNAPSQTASLGASAPDSAITTQSSAVAAVTPLASPSAPVTP